jgi:hypothetical protein
MARFADDRQRYGASDWRTGCSIPQSACNPVISAGHGRAYP